MGNPVFYRLETRADSRSTKVASLGIASTLVISSEKASPGEMLLPTVPIL